MCEKLIDVVDAFLKKKASIGELRRTLKEMKKEKQMNVMASACLCGISCRWHGKKCYKVRTIKDLEKKGINVIPVCPEELGGLPTPRPPVRTIHGKIFQTDETRESIGLDVTNEFTEGAREALRQANACGVERVYFLRNSPSCALNGVAGKIFTEAGIEVIPTW